MKKLIDIIEKGENSEVEFKSTLRVDVKTGKVEKYIEQSVLKTIAAFLNSAGGTLLIGITDNKVILGLDLDFNSFTNPDKLDEFQKHLDNIISRSFGSRFHRYIKIDFEEVDEKRICVLIVKEKSQEPVYIISDTKQESFYIRRLASSIELKPSETLKYVQEHWNQKNLITHITSIKDISDIFVSKQDFTAGINQMFLNKNSSFYSEIKEHWNCYTLIEEYAFLNNLVKRFLPKSIDYGLLLIISDFARKHLYNDQQAKYIYNQPHIYLHTREEEGYDLLIYSQIRLVGIMYATAIENKVDIDIVSSNYKNMQSIYSGMVAGMIDNLSVPPREDEPEYPTNYHWLIGEIFSMTSNWLDLFSEKENFVPTYSYVDFIPFNISLCLSELYKAYEKKKISMKFVVSQCYYGALIYYFSPLINMSLKRSIEKYFISGLPSSLIKPVFDFSLNEKFAIRYERLQEGDFGFRNQGDREILNQLRLFLYSQKKL